MENTYKVLMGKSDRETGTAWLPLWMHLRDTAGIMKKLAVRWLPEAVVTAAGMEYEQFAAVAVFLGAVHDIAKASSYFQYVITSTCPEKYEEILSSGFVVNKTYRSAGKTPHAHAGQWILQSEKTGFGVHESLAIVVGAHHGKPISKKAYQEGDDLLQLYPVNFYGTEKNSEVEKLWKKTWQDILAQALNLAGFQSVSQLPVLSPEAQVLFSGLLIIADWIASNPAYFPLIPLDDGGRESLYPQRVNAGWEKAAFPKGWHLETNVMDEGLFRKRFGFPFNEVQKCMLEVINNSENPGIFILEAQMGIGKTEAALGAVEVLVSRKKEGGLFFGLPTQATSNGLFKRLYEWGTKVSEETASAISLAHGSAEYQDDYYRLMMEGRACVEEDGEEWEGLNVHPWFQGNKRKLLANVVIGTVDQFLMASLRRKHFMLRHIGLAGKVVVIDECHAYDDFMLEFLDRSLQWMAAYGVPVILLSATLPAKRRRALTEGYVKAYSKYQLGKRKPKIQYMQPGWDESTGYPLLTWTDGEKVEQIQIEQKVPEKRVRIRYADSISDVPGLLEERLRDGGCACIIANTVRAAQEIYTECTNKMKDAKVILYHAQFILPDRYQKEKVLLEKMGKTSGDTDRNKLVLIGTQVLEQSLDYDADIMITQLCPIDLLLQRIGRLHRHRRYGEKENYSRPDKLRKPECIILRDGEELYDSGSQAVYGDYLLMRTSQVLGNGMDIDIKIPEDIPFLVQKVYNEDDNLQLEGERYLEAVEEYRNGIKKRQEKAKGYLMKTPPDEQHICGILDNMEGSGEKAAEAAVRDGVESIEVLLMKRGEEGGIRFVDNENQGFLLYGWQVPDSAVGRKIAMQRLRLPGIFSREWNQKAVIDELEDRNRRELAEWQQSPWIRGELVLLLNQDNQTELAGYELSYSFEKGLECKKREKQDAGE